MAEWVVTYRTRTPRVRVVVWAVVSDVPAEVDSRALLDALEAWRLWPAWQARVRAGASLDVRRRRAGDAPDGGTVVPWAELAPAEKRIGVVVSGPVYASIVRAARAEGLSLRAWCAAALSAVAGVVLEGLEDGPPANGRPPAPDDDVPPAPRIGWRDVPAPAFEDVPLPGVTA